MTGLYVHIPFCLKKCHYCDFVITASGSREKHDDFIWALEKEADHFRTRFSGTVFDTCYIGGGTPSALRAEEMEQLFRIVRENFKIKEDAEVTCETNPGDSEVGAILKNFGVNRISLGAQSFNEATLKRLNRAHGALEISKSFHVLRSEGFKNISLDLMLSLPEESWADVENSLHRAVDLGPEHVSLYELTIEEKTVFGREHRKGKLKIPNEETQLGMLSAAAEFLKANGYRRYELLNYAKPGFESRHNRLYWANEEYLGLGPGAFSYFGGKRFRRAASFEEYMAKMKNDDWRLYEEEMLNPQEKEIESFLLALRLVEGAQVSRFKNLIPRITKDLKNLEAQGLVLKERQTIRLTPRGQLLAETVFAELSDVTV